ncbi:potassium channel family protein [Pseudomonas sp. B21-035]|uniref:potassium channel family protein n=1 Tax=Pseudomonas sp. B21-035 TaxID=2895484 RepID=UPI00215F7EF6|nr:potassium channel family protein [Pseudomonas sp. B21-035]UVL56244.1 potassium channel family protein [Pseudomonas sp. B21-035]
MTNYISAEILWKLSPGQFNEWRAKNDLPVIFEYFRETLPDFDVWLATIGISEYEIMLCLPLGCCFNGEGEHVVIKKTTSYRTPQYFCISKSDSSSSQWDSVRESHCEKNEKLAFFTPYFEWIKIKTGKELPVDLTRVGLGHTNRFSMGAWRNVRPNSRTSIWRSPELLKLGEVTVPDCTVLSEMNLDFADLDGLRIAGVIYGGFNVISYSSLANLTIENTEQAFYRFKYCRFKDTKILNSKIQDFYFEKCEVGNFYAESSTFFRLSFARCRVLPFIDNCDLKDLIVYSPERNETFSEDAYRLLKNAYNIAGQKKFAATYLYQEQLAHRRNLFRARTYFKYSDLYPRGNPGKWSNFIKYRKGKQKVDFLKSKVKYLVSYFSRPKYLAVYAEHKLQWFYSLLDWALWGHGVKLHRLAFSSSFFILIFAILYRTLGDQLQADPAPSSFFDYLYFSMVTFTTLGYGDILPKTTLLRMICGVEAFLGAFMMGLVVAGFTNRKTD